MPLSADTLLDRLYLKTQITRWRLIAIIAVVMTLVVVLNRHTSGSPIETDHIARVTLEGVISDDIKRDELFQDLRDNPRVKAVLVRLDTPGGSAVAGVEVFNQLREIAQVKPVVAVMRDLSASAGYLIAIGADRIFAREATLTGSIGVIIEAAEFTELAEKIGVTPITIKTGPLKDALSPTSKASPEAIRAMQDVVDDFFQTFVSMVAERRKLPREEVLKLADGRVFTGNQALRHKMIDAIGSEDDAVAWLEAERKLPKNLEIREAEPEKDELPGWVDRLAGTVMQKIMPTASGKLDGLVAIWHPAVQLQ